MRRLLALDPAARPSAAAALQLPYFQLLPPAQMPVLAGACTAAARAAIDEAFAFETETEPPSCQQIRSLLCDDIRRWDDTSTLLDASSKASSRNPAPPKKSFSQASEECIGHLKRALDSCMQSKPA